MNLQNFRERVRQPRVILAAIGVVTTITVAWFAFSGGPEHPLGPQTPARAHGAAAPAPPARPAKLAKPKPVTGAPEPIVTKPAEPDPVAPDGSAPPAHHVTTRQGQRLAAKAGSLLSAWLKEARKAEAHIHPSTSVPAPAAEPQKPPEPEKAATPAPPTYAYVPCPPGFRFTGAIQQPDATFANINGRFVRVGGKVSGAKLVSINASSVVLEREGKRFIVSFDMNAPAPQVKDDNQATKSPTDEAENSVD